MKTPILFLLASFACAFAQVPAGLHLIKDRKQQCQLAVPAGWTADKIMPGNVSSPDKKASVIFGAKPAGATYSAIATMAKDMFKPAQMFDESAKRTFFASAPKNGKSSWYVVLSTSPVCEAQIDFREPAFEATAKKMVESLSLAK